MKSLPVPRHRSEGDFRVGRKRLGDLAQCPVAPDADDVREAPAEKGIGKLGGVPLALGEHYLPP